MKTADKMSIMCLADILAEQNLYRAWESVSRKNGAAGLDHVTIDDYARRVREELASIQRDVAARQFTPSPLMVFQREKAHGGHRELTIATLRDRILARAIAQVFNERLDGGFAPQSYAYRFRKGALKAVAAAQQACRKASHVMRADIEEFFDRMDHAILQSCLAGAGADDALVDLVMRLMRAPRFDGVSNQPGIIGVPQGSPLSPVLSNLYLNPVDKALAGDYPRFIRYADDIVVFNQNADEASGAMRRLEDLLGQVKLGLSVSKTRVYRVPEGFLFLGFVFTPNGHSAGREARERLHEKLDEGPCADENHEEYVRRRESIVRGWNNYFRHEGQADAARCDDSGADGLLNGEGAVNTGTRPGKPGRSGAEADGCAATVPDSARPATDAPTACTGTLRDLRRQLTDETVEVDSPAYRDLMRQLAEHYEKVGLHGAVAACRKAVGLPEPVADVAVPEVSHGCRTVELWMDLFGHGAGMVTMGCVDRLGRMGYRPHTDKLTPQLLEHHWQGRRTLAVPVYLPGDQVRFGVIDLDISRRGGRGPDPSRTGKTSRQSPS